METISKHTHKWNDAQVDVRDGKGRACYDGRWGSFVPGELRRASRGWGTEAGSWGGEGGSLLLPSSRLHPAVFLFSVEQAQGMFKNIKRQYQHERVEAGQETWRVPEKCDRGEGGMAQSEAEPGLSGSVGEVEPLHAVWG